MHSYREVPHKYKYLVNFVRKLQVINLAMAIGLMVILDLGLRQFILKGSPTLFLNPIQ